MSDSTNRPGQGRKQTIRDQSKKVEDRIDKLQGLTTAQKKKMRDLEQRNTEFQQAYSELVNRTEAVCHDLMLTRPRGDTWGIAFAYLTNYSLAQFGLARQCGDKRIFDAMLINLVRLSDAMSRSFPDRKLVIDPWRRAANAFGNLSVPSYDTKPHPHVDSLSPLVLTLRDTGPSLSDFREFFAASDSGLHIIRPA